MSHVATERHGKHERHAQEPLHAYPRRWFALVIIAVAQLMVVLDATVVNVALPHAKADLGISDANQQWVVTAYTLTFGGLLLLGGRVADYWGRKRTFVVGILGFAVASGLGGGAWDETSLFLARALQGVFGALLAPASLALLSVLFVDAKERAKAFGVYGAIAGGGAALGLVLGGVLTDYAHWRWCLLVNIPVALVAVALAVRVVPESRAQGNTKYDIPGAVLATLGLSLLVYGFTKAGETDAQQQLKYGWTSPVTLGFIGVALLLLALFVIVETRIRNPLLPMRIVLQRTRGGAYLASTLIGAGFIGAVFFVSLYFQIVLHYTPLQSGLRTLPISAGVLMAAGLSSALLPKIGPKPVMATGAAVAAAGMILLTRIGVDTSYATHVLPAMLILGFGLGCTFVPLGNIALVGVDEHDAGAASAVVNASQQVGGSLGTALLNTVAITAATSYFTDHQARAADPRLRLESMVDGYVTAFWWGSVLLAVAAVVVILLVRAGKDDVPAEGAVHLG
ncbi:MFS transporter [Dactylosporangium aurantiacum]|uniref:MFS transporter n=1 Tax=Dactylosporangium aurantiacum TaxID=35754 RepID=A0A9Q9INP5_9ACTN|nr:MFS transporter [Dactylosporangium aurantiacum]MDG6109321.1 MFS transporter [Dactylosporangium aurantiacum]UWZ56430.1 MFS transporter [Dactylosporangium aurantiacum]